MKNAVTSVFLVALLWASSLPAQVTNPMPERVLVKMAPDYARPFVYALNQGDGSAAGTLLALNSTNGAIQSEITVNTNPTDMVVSPVGDALYVINAGSRTISKVDLATFSVVAEETITTPNTYALSNPLYLALGASNLVYFTDGGWAPSITTFDFAHGTNVAVYDDGDGAGGIATTRDGSTLYRWRQYGWGAGNVNSWVTRYAITNGILSPEEESFTSWRRDPTDTPILLDGAERWVFNKQQLFSATNVAVTLEQFSDSLYAISLDGSLAFGPTEVFSAQSGSVLTNLPFSSTVQALSGDQRALFRYDANASAVVVYDMTAIATVSGPQPLPTPADGAVVDPPLTTLAWTPSPMDAAYDVYFGTNQAQVAAATPATSQYLGRVNSTGIPLAQTLVPGASYFWRVDVAGFSETNTGPVWAFTAARITVVPAQLNLSSVTGYSPGAVTLSVGSADGITWSAAVGGSNWLGLGSTNGTTPTNLTISFNSSALPAGVYTNTVQLTAGGLTLAIPVTLNVAPLKLVKMATDYERPYIYALQAPAQPGQPGQLLVFNTFTETIEAMLAIGTNPTDLAVHYGEERLYITSWGENATYCVDLPTLSFLPSLPLGTDIYKINAGAPGRIITEGLDQWIGVNLVDTSSGAVISSAPWPEREGEGASGPGGTVYYHCDNNISDAHVHKFMLTNDVFTEVAESLQHPYGTRNLVLAADGTRLFWNSYVYDAELNELGSLGEEIWATTAHGEVALGQAHAFNVDNGAVVYTWPVNSTVMAVSGDQTKVFLYDATAGKMDVITMSQIMSVAAPGINPAPANGGVANLPLPRLSWTPSLFALTYQVFFGTSPSAVTAADTNAPEYLGSTTAPFWALTNAISPGAAYYWRVDAVGYSSVTAGRVWGFNAALASLSPASLTYAGVTGLPILPQTVTVSAPSNTTWSISTGQSWVSASPASGVGSASVQLRFSMTNLPSGAYTSTVMVAAGGLTLSLPMSVQLFDLQATKVVPDPNRDYVYVLHPGSGNFDDAFVLFLNTASGVVERVLPIGSNPTDLSVNSFEDRLYVSNWQRQYTRVVDLKTQSELAPLDLGTDVYHLSAGRAGRLVVQGNWEWVTLGLVDTADGAWLATQPLAWQGDGVCDPSGGYYYHADDGISDAALTKYYIAGDRFAVQASAGPSGAAEFGGANLRMSLDGTRLFWAGGVYDATPNLLQYLGTEIYGCSTNGEIAFGNQQAFDTTGGAVFALPFSSSVMAVDRANAHLWYFDANLLQMRRYPILAFYAPAVVTQPSGTTNIVGDSLSLTVQATGHAPLAYQWQCDGTNLTGATNLTLALNNVQLSQSGAYQVIVTNGFGSATSTVAQVWVVNGSAIVTQPQSARIPNGSVVAFSVACYGPAEVTYQWQFNGVDIDGATNATFEIPTVGFANAGFYRVITRDPLSVNVSSNATLVVYNLIAIEQQPQGQTVSVGSSVQFSVLATGDGPLQYQWLRNGASLPGQTARTLTLRNVDMADVGFYSVVVTSADDLAGSSWGQLAVVPRAPVILGPPEIGRFTNTLPVVRGQVDPRAEVLAVFYTLNGNYGGALYAPGASTWSIGALPLQPGKNVLSVWAVNQCGNGLAATRDFYYTQFSQWTLLTNGAGSITRHFAGSNLVVSNQYWLTAVPGPNQVFAGWIVGGTNQSGPFLYGVPQRDLTFAAQPVLVVEAVFVPSPFRGHEGLYQGLFAEPGNIAPESAGEFSFRLQRNGAFSGKLVLAGEARALAGQFDPWGAADVSSSRNHAAVVHTALQLNLTNNTVAGSVSDGNWVASLAGSRSVTTAPTAWAGRRTLVFPGADDGASPYGDGYGTATVTAPGAVTFAGRLSDGSAFSRSTYVCPDGSCPFYLPLYGGRGLLIGWLNFGAEAGAGDNLCSWLCPAFTGVSGSGFTNSSLSVVCSRFSAAARPVLNLQSGTLILSGPGMGESITNYFTVSTGGQFVFPTNSGRVQLSVNPKNGLVTGSFPAGASAALTSLQGAILQDQTNAWGFLTNSSGGGRFRVRSTP